MTRTFRAGVAALALFALALLVPSTEARAAEELNVHDWLARGGVRLVAVEFYATWCKPCMEAMPRWKKLKEKYGPQGLRVIVVNTQDPDGACRALPFVPDETVCDLEGNVADAFKLQGKLPSAYLWSWQGNLLVAKGHIDEVEKAVADYLRDAPRVVVEGGEGVGAEIVAAMRDRLTEEGKVLVLAGKEEQAAIDAAKRASQGARYDEKLACEIGKEIPPNALLKVSRVSQGKASYLNASLLDLAGGCLLSSSSSEWTGDLRRMTQDTSTKLLAKLRRSGGLQMPAQAKAAPAPLPGPVKREDKIQNAAGTGWIPTSVDPVMVSFESQPSGARVEMDGATLCAATPCKKMIDPGLRVLRMSADKYVTKEERVRVDGDEQKVAWKLEANTAVVSVETGAVSGVPITVDGEAAGKSPLRLDLGAGPHRIEIKDACYEPGRADVSVERGVSKRVDLNGVQKTAGLRVELSDAKDEPVQGDVKLDGVVVGRTWKTLTVPACGRELEVVAKEGGVKQSVSLRAQETTKLAAKLSGGGSAPGGMALIPGGGGVQTFSIDVTEVTVDAYAACVRAGNCSKPNDGGACNWGKSDRGNHPVNCVDWNQAKAFCGWSQKRLPTEQEWQRAAESAQGRTYPWGEAAPSNQLCWDGEGSSLGKGNRQSTCAAGSFPAGDSAQGVKDLSGNVWEWTDSCYDSSCAARVHRGGSWFLIDPSDVRAAVRGRYVPSIRCSFIGFRCSRSN